MTYKRKGMIAILLIHSFQILTQQATFYDHST